MVRRPRNSCITYHCIDGLAGRDRVVCSYWFISQDRACGTYRYVAYKCKSCLATDCLCVLAVFSVGVYGSTRSFALVGFCIRTCLDKRSWFLGLGTRLAISVNRG